MSTLVGWHPDVLLDQERAGTLAASDRDKLDAHLARCAACRFERSVQRDFARELESEVGEPTEIARLVLGAVRGGRIEPDTRDAPRGAAGLPRKTTLLVAAAIFVAATAAALVAARTGLVPGVRTPPAVESYGRSLEAVGSALGREVASAPTATAPAPPEPPALAPAPAPSVARSVPAPSASAADGETAATLFARANAARRRGDRDEALRLYRRLQERFPASDEARLSHATMGKLVLEGEPDAALAEFDRYLGAAKGGALGEEALVGRAVALGRLGRHAEEKAAWQELLARHPRSVHAARARARIAELAAK